MVHQLSFESSGIDPSHLQTRKTTSFSDCIRLVDHLPTYPHAISYPGRQRHQPSTCYDPDTQSSLCHDLMIYTPIMFIWLTHPLPETNNPRYTLSLSFFFINIKILKCQVVPSVCTPYPVLLRTSCLRTNEYTQFSARLQTMYFIYNRYLWYMQNSGATQAHHGRGWPQVARLLVCRLF